MKRNYAAHQLVVSADGWLPQYVVTLEDSRVVHCSALEGEPPFTQWLGGAIILSSMNALPPMVEFPMAMDELVQLLTAGNQGTSAQYAWHVTPVDVASGIVRSARLLD